MDEIQKLSRKERRLLVNFRISEEEMDDFDNGITTNIKDIYSKAAVSCLIDDFPSGRCKSSLKSCFVALLSESPSRGTPQFDELIKLRQPKKKKKSIRTEPEYERFGTIHVGKVLPFIDPSHWERGDEKREKELCGHSVYMHTVRIRTYRVHGIVCKSCGLKGKYFAVERQSNNPSGNPRCHLNLYGIDEKGCEIMMTVDHVIAKSKGGADHINNTVSMCSPCNFKKSDKHPVEIVI